MTEQPTYKFTDKPESGWIKSRQFPGMWELVEDGHSTGVLSAIPPSLLKGE